jgi:hypothetical protein
MSIAVYILNPRLSAMTKSIPSNNPEYPPIKADKAFGSVMLVVINIIIQDAIITANKM